MAVLTAGWHLGLWRLGISEERTELVLVYSVAAWPWSAPGRGTTIAVTVPVQ